MSAALLLVLAGCVADAETLGGPPFARPTGSAVPSSDPDPDPGPPSPSFHGSVSPIDAATRARMSASWRPGCPVPVGDLRLLTLTHWGFDGAVHAGALVVHEDHAAAVLGIFEKLFAARFPIERMQLVDVYDGDDDRSMAANNTSAFNCRASAGDPDAWSQHSYGTAIDINPVQNPYVSRSAVEPPSGAHFVDRATRRPGMVHAGDAVVRAFASIGWSWGGAWASAKDYQHFSANGR